MGLNLWVFIPTKKLTSTISFGALALPKCKILEDSDLAKESSQDRKPLKKYKYDSKVFTLHQ